MNHAIQVEDQTFTFTTEHAASSYGMPVLVWAGAALGPADKLPFNPHRRAAQVVRDWARDPDRTNDEYADASQYLRQWPEGPQLPERDAAEGH